MADDLARQYAEHKDMIATHCFFGQERFLFEGPPEDGVYAEEVGEYWSTSLRTTVLAHPDCTPLGNDAIQRGDDPEWKMP